jgi:O-antigen ligase
MICAGLLVLSRRRINWPALFGNYPVVWIFYAFALLSVTWSPEPFVALKRFMREAGSVIMTLIILTENKPLEALRRVFIRCAVVLIPLSVLFIKYYPLIGRYTQRWTYQTMWCGVTGSKNALGLLAMLSTLFLGWHFTESWRGIKGWRRRVAVLWPEMVVFAMCLWILNIADSATSVSCCLLGSIAFIAAQAFSGINVKATVMAVTLVGLAGWLALWTPGARGVVAESAGRDATLTSRTEIWAKALALPTNPVVGAGFLSVWITPEGAALKDAEGGSLAHSHNGYLETYLNLGAVGVVLLLGVLFLAIIQAGRHLSVKTPAGAIYVAVVVTGIVYNFTEVTFNYNDALGLLLWLIALSHPSVVLRQEDTILFDAKWQGTRAAQLGKRLDVRRSYSQQLVGRRVHDQGQTVSPLISRQERRS